MYWIAISACTFYYGGEISQAKNRDTLDVARPSRLYNTCLVCNGNIVRDIDNFYDIFMLGLSKILINAINNFLLIYALHVGLTIIGDIECCESKYRGARYERGNRMSPRGLAWSTRTLQRADTRRRGRSEEEKDREERTGENALKRVIRSRGRYQVQTSFGACKREAALCAHRRSALEWQHALSPHIYIYIYECTYNIYVYACARVVNTNEFVQRCKSVGLWEVYTCRVLLS